MTEPAGPREVRVSYFALLRDEAGCDEERVVTASATAGELYAELSDRYRFSLPPERLRVAVNAGFADWETALADGDLVVFIPPVAGG
ncbi:MAG: MoaD/ThiS family protein [Spirochaetaceae bacterium]|nr:MoaD/ThiS family protein [Spirochaetaceae bacterium]